MVTYEDFARKRTGLYGFVSLALSIACSNPAAAPPGTTPSTAVSNRTRYHLDYRYSLGQDGQGVLYHPSDLAFWNGTLYVIDQTDAQEGSTSGLLYAFKGSRGRVLASLPEPRDLALDRKRNRLLVVADNNYSVYQARLAPNGELAGPPEVFLRFEKPEGMVEGVVVGANGHFYLNSPLSPKRQSILEYDADGNLVKSFGGFEQGDRRTATVQMNRRELLWDGDRLCTAGVINSYIRCYDDQGKEIAGALVDTTPHTPGPKPPRPDGTKGVFVTLVLQGLVPFEGEKMLSLIWNRRQEREQYGRVFGLVVSRNLGIVGEVRPSKKGSPDRLASMYTRGVRISDREFALADTWLSKRVDVFERVPE